MTPHFQAGLERLQIQPMLGSMSEKRRIKCAICGKETEYFADPMGPFCSQRCKLIDLGKWLGEEYRVSEPLRPEHFTEFEDPSDDELDRP